LAIRETARVLEGKLAALGADHELFRAGREAPRQRGQDVTFEDFANGYRGWFVTGDAFGSAPADAADIQIDVDHEQPARRLLRGAASGRISGRLQGALRSKTFTIAKRYILYRARGRDVRVNLIIDGFQQIRNPIYGGLTFTISAAQPRWHAQDVGMW